MKLCVHLNLNTISLELSKGVGGPISFLTTPSYKYTNCYKLGGSPLLAQ